MNIYMIVLVGSFHRACFHSNCIMDRTLEHVFMLAKCFMILIGLTVGDQCKQSDVSTPGKALRNHIFKSVTVTGPFECHELCESDLQCHSYNFLIFGKICELNNSTKEASARDYVTDEARFYMRIWPPIGSISILPSQNATSHYTSG